MGCCCLAPNSRHPSDRLSIIPRQIYLEPSSIVSSPVVTPGFIQLPFYSDFSYLFNELCKMERSIWTKKKRLFKKIHIFLDHAILRSESFLKTPTKSNLDLLLKTKTPHQILRKNETIINEKTIIEENENNEDSSENLISEPGENYTDEEKVGTNIEIDLKKSGILKIQIREAKFSSDLLKSLQMELPFIELRVKTTSSEHTFTSKKMTVESTVVYNEFFEVKFEDLDYTKGIFLIKLLYVDGGAQICMQLCDEFIFSMEELENMEVVEKVLFFKDNFGNVLSDLKVRCQLVWNYCNLVENWLKEFKLKREIIEKIEEKMEEVEKKCGRTCSIGLDANNLDNKADNSLVSLDSSLCQSLYDNQFYVK